MRNCESGCRHNPHPYAVVPDCGDHYADYMQQNNTSAANARLVSFLNSPISQATVTGALSLIPGRKYPTWLRRSLIWAPTVVGLAGAAGVFFGVTNPEAGSRFAEPRKNTGRADLDYLPTHLSDGQQAGRTATKASVIAGIGLFASLTTAAGFWADEKIEQGLRRFNVPFPRAAMGIAAGALTWWQAKQNDRQDQQNS